MFQKNTTMNFMSTSMASMEVVDSKTSTIGSFKNSVMNLGIILGRDIKIALQFTHF